MKRSIQLTCAIFLISVDLFGQTKIEKVKSLFEQRKYEQVKTILTPIGDEDDDFAFAQYYLGRVAYEEKQYDDAVDFLEAATEGNPKEGDYFNWLGDAYAAIGKDANMFKQMSVGPKALRAWEKAAKLDSKNINARASLVSTYMMAPAFMGGGEAKARAVGAEVLLLLDEALVTTPDNYLHHYWYGKASAITALKLDRGEASLKKYLTHTPVGDEPSHAAAYMRLGQIQEKQGNKADAKKYFELALKLDPKMKSAQEGLERTSK